MPDDATQTPAGAATQTPAGAAGTGAPAGRPRPPRRGYLLPGTIALLVLIGLAALVDAVGQTHRSPATLAASDVETYITQGLQATGDRSSFTVACPASEPVRAGTAFDCSLRQAGRSRTVRVTETDSSGTFRFAVLPPGP